jgi:predicted DNA binding CopG/RHH family protein
MKNQNIDSAEELSMFESAERGEFVSLKGDAFLQEKTRLEAAASNTLSKKTKRKPINIRVIEEDVRKIKALALQEGIPYQTFLTSIIHKVAVGRIKLEN